jgi:acyl carrier protein
MYAKILAKILSIVAGLAKGELSIDEDTVLQADLSLTSLQVMELVLEVEDEFDISFPLNRLPDIRTVKELTEAIVATLDQ